MTDRFHTICGTDSTRSAPAAASGPEVEGQQLLDLLALLDGLEHRLATQPVIEQSKGILMGHFAIDADTAFNVLKRWSSHANLKLRDISQIIVTTAATDPPGDPQRKLIGLFRGFDAGQIPNIQMNACLLQRGNSQPRPVAVLDAETEAQTMRA